MTLLITEVGQCSKSFRDEPYLQYNIFSSDLWKKASFNADKGNFDRVDANQN